METRNDEKEYKDNTENAKYFLNDSNIKPQNNRNSKK
jgi:hypothetical protein